jgi:hypothetical protein
VESEAGELSLTFELDQFEQALNDFSTTITKMTSAEYFEKERNVNRFYTQFNMLIIDKFQSKFNMVSKHHPLTGDFSGCEIPWAILANPAKPIFLFPISGRQTLANTLLAVRDLQEEHYLSLNCSIYENIDSLDQQNIKRAYRLFDKQISSLAVFEEHGEYELERIVKLVS